MDVKMITSVLLVALAILTVTCQAAPIDSGDAKLLTQVLEKFNKVLDNYIDEHNIDSETKQDVEKELEQRNEDEGSPQRTARWSDFLVLICQELQAHGLTDPACNGIGPVADPERSVNDDEINLERTARAYVNVISEICEVFRSHGIIIDECLAEDDIRVDGERRETEADTESQRAEQSVPEPAPQAQGGKDNSDLSLEKVLQYLQYLRAKRNEHD